MRCSVKPDRCWCQGGRLPGSRFVVCGWWRRGWRPQPCGCQL